MSTALALAATSAALRRFLEEHLGDTELQAVTGGPVTVTVEPPGRPQPGQAANAEGSRLNLFLYGVARNGGWSNAHLPERDATGARTGPARIALDLHYLMSAYGAAEFAQEAILGHAMLALSGAGVLGRETVRRLLPVGAGADRSLALAGLADQVEQLRITHDPLDLDAMTKLWSVLQAPFRPTTAYRISVALIEARGGGGTAPPVRRARLVAGPMALPRIVAVVNAAPGEPWRAIAAGETLRIEGSGLASDGARLLIDGEDHTALAAPDGWRDDSIALALPNPLPAGMTAGAKAVQLLLPVLFDGQARGGESSNAATFLLRPRPGAATVSDRENAAGGRVRAVVSLPVEPPVRHGQVVRLLLDPAPGSPPGRAGASAAWTEPEAAADPPPVSNPRFAVVLPPGRWLYRVSVDGAESALSLGPQGYDGPAFDLAALP